MKKILILGTLSIALFTGCSQKTATNTTALGIGNPSVDYVQGYKGGCSSGYNDYIRDQKLYDFNADYRYGWNKGYDECYKKAINN